MPETKTERALRFAHEAQDEILSDSESVTSLLRKCLTICQLTGKDSCNKWIQQELNGYGEDDTTYGELEKSLPTYRKVKALYYDDYGNMIQFDDSKVSKLLQKHPISNPVQI
jgi:hypothetical protein